MGRTKTAVATKLAELKKRLAEGGLGPRAAAERERLGTYLRRWQRERAGTVRPNTQRTDAWAVPHLVEVLGSKTLVGLTEADVRELLATKRAAGLSEASLRILKNTLSAALRHAVAVERTLPRNVARAVPLPTPPRPPSSPLTPADVRHLLQVAEAHGDRLLPLWTLALYAGCRPSELLGLRWSDVDWEGGEYGMLHVRRQLERPRDRRATFGELKTAAAHRSLVLTAATAAVLRQWHHRQVLERARYRDVYAANDLVFCSRWGTPLLPRNVQRAFKRLLGLAGLPAAIRFYDARHSTGTNLAALGVDAATVAAILGHANPGFTLARYVRPFEDTRHAATRRLADAFDGDSDGGVPGSAPRRAPADSEDTEGTDDAVGTEPDGQLGHPGDKPGRTGTAGAA
jgi:integrase